MLWHGKNFRGFLNKASQVLFNKTGTSLNSTNVQDAISEIDSNLSVQDVSSLVTVTHASITSAKISAHKLGKLVFISLSAIETSADIANWQVLFTVDASISSLQPVCVNIKNGTNIYMSANGISIRTLGDTLPAGSYAISFMYLTN